MARRMARGENLAWRRHRRNPHPEGFARRQAAGIGKRVQHDVDVIVLTEEGAMARAAAEFDPLRSDVMRGKGSPYPFRGRFV